MSQSAAVLKDPPTSAALAPLTSRAEAVAAARALVPRLRERAAYTEEIRRVPEETIAELHAAGLFRVLTPKRFGGSELGMATLIEATVELAQGCVSSGWVFGNLVGHYWLLSQFPLAAQEAVHQKSTSLVSTLFRFGGEAPVRVDGGYRIKNGQGKWASGIDHADWVILGVTPAGEAPCFMLVNRQDFDIVDDWHTSGMRGTGSKSVHVADAFIADDRVIRFADVITATSPGGQALDIPLFRLPMNVTLPFSLVGAPVGAAFGALRVYSESNGNRLKTVSEEEQSDQSATFARVGEAGAMIDSVFALVMRDAERIDALNSIADVTLRQRMEVSRDLAFAAQTARRAVNSLIEASGGSTIYNTSEIQRIWRDINGVCGHAAFTWDAAMASSGRFEFGLPPSKFDRRGK
jgi:3-hydroxy-9,10-secoandrosta-1,3,5(10)-triene-9,17-dione monooxygenase